MTLSEVSRHRSLIATVILSGALVALSGSVQAENAPLMGKKGTSPYVTHFIFRPVQSLEIKGVGTATLLEAVGTTQNLKGEPMLDKMAARCTALNVDSGDKKYIDGACALTDKNGDVIFSTFDTRDIDKSQPEINCGTHIITGGSGKYTGITGREPFACNGHAQTGWDRRLFRHGHPAQHDVGNQVLGFRKTQL